MADPASAIPTDLFDSSVPSGSEVVPVPAPAAESSSSSAAAASTSAQQQQQQFTTNPAELIKLGDQVIIYSSRNAIDSIILTQGKELQSRYGHYKHDTIVGVPWGSKFASSNGKGYVYLLKPTPELWTLALPHRTQILYLPDIAFITSYLDIKPGSKVIEAGTGSGSFSHSVARSVGPRGAVHSFEYHEERYGKALAEFEEHNLAGIITLKHRNVCQEGFELRDEVDSVFLDVPAPWEAVPHAKVALRKDRQSRICCFSPCIEQVLRTVSALSEQGFSDITMYECLLKTHEPAVFFQQTVGDAIDRIEKVEQKKSVRREGQIQEARRKKEAEQMLKRKRAEEEDGEQEEGSSKALRSAVGEAVREANSVQPTTDDGAESPAAAQSNHTHPAARSYSFKQGPLSRGHTSFLTFATLLPLEKEAKAEPVAEAAAVVETLVEEVKAEEAAAVDDPMQQES